MTTIGPTVGGIILCGGRGRRIGTDKAWLRFGDEHLLQRMVRIVGDVVNPVVAAGREGQSLPALPEGVAIVYDAVDNAGPLAGVAAGMSFLDGRCEAAFVAACDYPLLSSSLIHKLIGLLGDHQAVVVRDDRHLHPLLGVYRLSTRQTLSELLNRRELRAGHFARQCQARVIPAADLTDVDPELRSLRNVNDQTAYEQVIRDLGE
ncbi:MAG: molybdenum cofactor guanylyltransferase [Planctomycetes bacterium]|nr:molybdenum cofactor guanylyltransferase [Planctomycetota bacterium]